MPRHLKGQLIAVALLLMTALSLSAQKYLTYKTTGNVSRISGAKVTKVTKGSTLEGNTRLRINKNSEVWVVEDNKRRTLYKLRTVTGPKGKTVEELVGEAKKNVKAGISAINENILNGISVNKIDRDQFRRAGVSRITTNDYGQATILAGMLGPDETTQGNVQYAEVKKVDDGNHLYHFTIKNTTDTDMYANILLKDSDPEDIELMLPECIILNVGKEVDIADCQFYIPEMPFAGFILILSNEPFTAEDIMNELKPETQNTEREYLYQLVK